MGKVGLTLKTKYTYKKTFSPKDRYEGKDYQKMKHDLDRLYFSLCEREKRH